MKIYLKILLSDNTHIFPDYFTASEKLLLESVFYNDNKESAINISNETINWDYLLNFSRRHGIASFLYKYLKKNSFENVPEKTASNLKSYYYTVIQKNSVLIHEFNTISEKLSEKSINHIPLKGIYLITEFYEDPGIRPMSDIDLLIKPEDFEPTTTILQSYGYKLIPLKNKYDEKYKLYYNRSFVKSGILIEVHTNVFPPYSHINIDINSFWNNSVSINNSFKRKLSPFHNFLHFALHFDYNVNNRLVRLGWHFDMFLFKQQFLPEIKKDIDSIPEPGMRSSVEEKISLFSLIWENPSEKSLQNDIDNIQVNNFIKILRNKEKQLPAAKNLDYKKKLKLITNTNDKIMYVVLQIFPSKKFLDFRYKKNFFLIQYPMYWKSLIEKIIR